EKAAQEAVDSRNNTTLPLATLAYIQQKRGNLEAAKKTFAQLRDVSAQIDLSARPFARLAWLAGHAGYDEDWRIEKTYGEDFGDKRKNLRKLGPLAYAPPAAIPFTLPDENGSAVSSASYADKALLAIFYVGHSCSHCIEQLNAFAPETEAFRSAGIELLAIGTDAQPEIAKAHDLCEGELERFPFPLLADPELGVFKQYRAFDDFENLPLHATVLISPEGHVLWQDVSYEPFTDTKFLLEESQRLLSLRPEGR
ncbi:MAG: redoxin domain-containing protein, partial [Verrucomicrobiales bacterium]|nr:redoxin domain-containing protein [Verrucomicrobiales bacterium]